MADTEIAGLPVKQLLATPGLSPTLAKRIQEADADGNGVLTVADVFEVLRNEQRVDSERRLLWRIVIALAVVVVVLVGTLTGMTYGIVNLSKDSEVSPSGALVSMSTGEPLYISPGALSLGNVVHNSTASAAYANASAATGQLLQSGSSSELQYSGDITTEAILNGCRLLLGGTRSFTAFKGAGNNETVATVNVSSASVAACRTAISTSNVTGFFALVTYEGKPYDVYCVENSGTCQAFLPLTATAANVNPTSPPPPPTNSSASVAGRRRLLSGAFPDDSSFIRFPAGAIVQCSAAGCEDISETANAGRRLR